MNMATVVGLAVAVLTLPVFFYVGACLCGELKGKRLGEGEGERQSLVWSAYTHRILHTMLITSACV